MNTYGNNVESESPAEYCDTRSNQLAEMILRVLHYAHYWGRWVHKAWLCDIDLDLHSLSNVTSYRQISWNLETARLDDIMIVSLWNLTGTLAAVCQISERLEKIKPDSRGFETSRDLVVRRQSA